MTKVSAAEFDARDDLPDWRYLLGRIEATFRTDSFDTAVVLAGEVATAGKRLGRHPDIDLRYPDLVHVMLPSAADGTPLTDDDLVTAKTVSELAANAGTWSHPHSAQAIEVAIDAMDIDAVRPFWKAVLGYVDDAPAGYTGQILAIKDPAGIGPPFWFQQMERSRTERNRFHIDVTVAHDLAEQRIAAALEAGGTIVTDSYARSWWVLADAEGNQACICTWQDRT